MIFLKTSAAKSDPEVTSLLINFEGRAAFLCGFCRIFGFSTSEIFRGFCNCMGIYLASTWLAQADRLILR